MLRLRTSVTAIADKAFLECRDLTEVTIGDNVKSIGESAFNTCDKLETVNWNSNLKSIGKKAFAYTKVSNDLLLPAALETIGYMAFYHAEWTKNLALGANVSYIGYDAFGAMYDLATITVDPANKRYASPNDCNAILARNSVTNVLDTLVAGSRGTTVVPEGVTIILDEAFSWRRGLTLTLPTTLKEIENYAFDNALINDLYILSSTLPTTGSDTFGGDYSAYKVLHVQPELVETCKTTAPWSLFQQIVAIGSEGINGITTDDAKATWFTIDGKRIEGGMPTQPGLYIRNGKKVIIR